MRYQMILSAALMMLLACYSPAEWEGHDVTIAVSAAGADGLTIERAKVLLSGQGRQFETTTDETLTARFGAVIPAGTWVATVSLLRHTGPSCDFGSRQIVVPHSEPIVLACL